MENDRDTSLQSREFFPAQARAVECAARHLPGLSGLFVCTVAPRHRRADGDLLDEARAALRDRVPALRLTKARCLWLFANAKFDRTLVLAVRPRDA